MSTEVREVMDILTAKVEVFAFIDDISIVTEENTKYQLDEVQEILKTADDANSQLKAGKSKSAEIESYRLGFKIKNQGLLPKNTVVQGMF